jgi:hypothetical protein
VAQAQVVVVVVPPQQQQMQHIVRVWQRMQVQK